MNVELSYKYDSANCSIIPYHTDHDALTEEKNTLDNLIILKYMKRWRDKQTVTRKRIIRLSCFVQQWIDPYSPWSGQAFLL